MRFKGKIAKWFYGLMLFVAVILIPIIIMAILENKIFVFAISFIIFAILEAFCISIAFHNFAELHSESLHIVFGCIRFSIPYSDIEEIKTTKDPAASLAASLDRIKIQYGSGKTVMLALQNKQEFFKEIQNKNHTIRII